MQQLIEFAGNHPILSAAFAAVLVALVVSEIARRRQGFRTLSPNEAVAFMNGDNVQVLDLSPAADFAKGHIVGAKNVPMSRVKDPDPELAKLIVNPLLVTCKTGQSAGQAAGMLMKHGAEDVAVLRGGMAQWTSDNFPVTRS